LYARIGRVRKAFLFDLDGTLSDTDSLHSPAWLNLLSRHGFQADEEFYKARISGRSNAVIIRELLPHLSEDEVQSVIDAKEADFRDLATDLEPLPGLLEFMQEGHGRGMKIALVTNAPGVNVPLVLATLGVIEYFDEIVLADDVGVGKPDPAPYAAALHRLGLLPEEAVAFEDSASGIASATGAGIPTVGIASTQQPGYLIDAGAFVAVQDFTDTKLWDLLNE